MIQDDLWLNWTTWFVLLVICALLRDQSSKVFLQDVADTTFLTAFFLNSSCLFSCSKHFLCGRQSSTSTGFYPCTSIYPVIVIPPVFFFRTLKKAFPESNEPDPKGSYHLPICISVHLGFKVFTALIGCARWRSWLRHCATADSIPDGVVGIFDSYNPSGRLMVLGSTHHLKWNEHKECLLGGKSGRCVWLTTLPPSCADCLEIWEFQPPGTIRACPGQYRDYFTFYGVEYLKWIVY